MINELLQLFNKDNIQVWAENGKIKFSGPKDKITDEFISILKENKENLLDYFASQSANDDNIVASKNQMGLWIERKLGSTDGAIHNGMIKIINGKINYDNIKDALACVINRHEALQITFYEVKGEVYITSGNIDESFFSVEELTEMEVEEACQYAKVKMNKTMDLANGPLFRASIYSVSEDVHIFCMWAHHIISDAFSLFIIEKEFYQFYDKIVNDVKHTLNNAGSYAQYIKDEQKYLTGNQYVSDMEYWKDSLDEKIKGSSLPKYKVETAGEYHYKPATYTDVYSKELFSSIQIAAKECQTTVYMLVFAMFSLALNKVNEGKRTSLGLFASNRSEEEYRSMVGYFSNALVFQFDVDGEMTLLQYVKAVKAQLLQMLGRQHTPFTCLVSEMNPNREERNPFFSVAFDSLLFPPDPQTQQLQKKLNVKDYALVKGSGEYDLIVWISESEEKYSLEYRYNAQLFEEYQIRSFAEMVEGLIKSICCDKDTVLERVPLLFGHSREAIDNINSTQKEITESSVFEVISRQCSIQKDKTAICCGEKHISYEEMGSLICYIRKWLKQAGVGKGDYVGVLLNKSCSLIPAILAIWSIEAVYVPIDPHFPVNRKEYIINNTGMSIILTERSLKSSVDNEVNKIVIEDIIEEWDINGKAKIEEDMNDFNTSNKEDIPAYVLYTSGSTGQPKGVVISQVALMNFLQDMKTQIALISEDKVLAITSISFDISLLEMFLPLTVGSEVVLTTHEEALDGRKILQTIKNKGVTVMQATPSSFNMLYDYFIKEKTCAPLLKSCLCGGEGYELDLVEKMQEMAGRVFNVFGPTETTIWSTIYEFPRPCSNLLIGKPIANTKVMVVNEEGMPLPLGVPGELLIGGKGVFKGYYNNPHMTEEVLLKLPDGEIYYRTGDWAYFNGDGNLKFLGRKDNQIKIRGFRIELSEIENVFKKHEAISKVAVVRIKENNGYSLVAVVVPQIGIAPDKSEIKQFIESYLPEYMIPSHIIIADDLPMTANRKIDKKAISNMMESVVANENVAVTTEESDLEKQIKEVWQRILKRTVYSVELGFFEAGGNSLLLNKLVIELEELFGKSIDIIKLLKYSTIRKMAAYISGEKVQNEQTNRNDAHINKRSQYLKRRKG